VCIGQTVDEAKEIFAKTLNVLDRECSG
jgi:hypothetical protein